MSYVGEMTRGYVYLGGQLLAVQEGREDSAKPDRVLWVHQDPVTKSQRLTDKFGNVVSTIDLDSWGGETGRSEDQSFQPRPYTTYERDANGGDEAMFRRYESRLTRFSQPDPYEGSYDLADPQSFNRYAYVQNDPVNFVDPSGLQPCFGAQCSWSDVANGFWGPGNLIDRPRRQQKIVLYWEYGKGERGWEYWLVGADIFMNDAWDGYPQEVPERER